MRRVAFSAEVFRGKLFHADMRRQYFVRPDGTLFQLILAAMGYLNFRAGYFGAPA